MGLIDEVNKSEQSVYSSLTVESLNKIIDKISKPFKSSNTAHSIVMYTGLIGYYIFKLTMAGVGVPHCYYHLDTFNRSRLIVLSLGKKSGLYKAVINLKNNDAKVQIRRGSEIIATDMSFDRLTEFLSEVKIEREYFVTKKGIKKYFK